MATSASKAKRRALAEERLTAVSASLAARLGIEPVNDVRPVRDPHLAATIDLERQADLLATADQKLAESLVEAEAGLDGIVATYETRIASLAAELADARAAAEQAKTKTTRGKAKGGASA